MKKKSFLIEFSLGIVYFKGKKNLFEWESLFYFHRKQCKHLIKHKEDEKKKMFRKCAK